MAYRLELPSNLDRIHDVFHVSMLRQYILDPSHVLTEQPVEIQENLAYEEEPVQILNRREQVLRNKTSAGEGIVEESYNRGSYLGARGPDAPSVPTFVFRMRYVPFFSFGF